MLQDKKYGLTQSLLATKVMPTVIPYTATPGLDVEQVTNYTWMHYDILSYRLYRGYRNFNLSQLLKRHVR